MGLAKFDDPEDERGFQEYYHESGRTLLLAATILIFIITGTVSIRDLIHEEITPTIIYKFLARGVLLVLSFSTLLLLLQKPAINTRALVRLQLGLSLMVLAITYIVGYAFQPVLTLDLYFRSIFGQTMALIGIAAFVRIPVRLLVFEFVLAMIFNWYLSADFRSFDHSRWALGQVYLLCTVSLSALLYVAQLVLERRIYSTKAQLDKQLALAEQANSEKSRFLAALSHDLRQPLTGLVGYLDLVRAKFGGSSDTSISTYLERAQGSASAIQNNLTRVLEIARLQDTESVVRFETLDLLDVLSNVGALNEVQLIQESIQLKVIQPLAGAAPVRSDFNLLFQILQNLIANAIKYRRLEKDVDSKIIISIAHLLTGQTKVSIVDNGIGIPKEQCALIFRPYYQINNSARESSKGLGLGLAFVSDAVKKLNGHSISVWSNGRSMTKINLILPTAFETRHLPENPLISPSRPLRNDSRFNGIVFLIIEDNQHVREFVDDTIKLLGGFTYAFGSPSEIVEAVSEDLKPDLIICDHNLPGSINGYQYILSHRARFKKNTPGLLITGNIRVKIPESAEGLRLLFKPFNSLQLIDALKPLLAGLVNRARSR